MIVQSIPSVYLQETPAGMILCHGHRFEHCLSVLTTPSCALFGLLTLSSPGAMGAFPSVHTYTEQ